MKKYYKEPAVELEPGVFDKYPAIIHVEEGTQPTGFTEITDGGELVKIITDKYYERLKDGREFYFKTVAALMGQVTEGLTTRTEAKMVQKELKLVRDELVLGQWLSAQEEINNITPVHTDQATFDYIKGVIDNYVLANY